MDENLKVETYYLDDDNNFVEPENATKGIIREVDEEGNLVRETWGTFEPVKKVSDEEMDAFLETLRKENFFKNK